MKLIRNTKIIFVASLFALSSCTPLDTVVIDSGYYDYDPAFYGPNMPPPPITNPLPPAPPSGHKPTPPKPDNRPDHKPDNKPNKPDNKPGNNIKPDNKPNKPNNTPTVNPGNNGHRPSGNQPGKRPSNSRRH